MDFPFSRREIDTGHGSSHRSMRETSREGAETEADDGETGEPSLLIIQVEVVETCISR